MRIQILLSVHMPVSYTHLDVYKRQAMNKPPRASILAAMVMLQSLSILLQNAKNLTPQQYVKWHPGGSLGASIKESGDR